MALTNKYNLPAALVAAIEKHEHVGADYTASGLSNSVRQTHLRKRHAAEAVEDASDKIWSALGTAFHLLMHTGHGKNELAEQYMELDLGGVKLSGTADLYGDDEILTDYKTTGTYTLTSGSHLPEWTAQLNTYALLYLRHGFPIKGLRVIAILRDWMKSRAKKDPEYPQCQVLVVEIPLWPEVQQLAFVAERIKLFEAFKGTPDDDLPKCTAEEMWDRGKGPVKCPDYCIGRDFCNQWKSMPKDVTPKADGPFTVKAKTPKKAGKVLAA